MGGMSKELRQKFYKSPAWQKVRKLQLARQPLCEDCGRIGALKAATVVDHVVSLASGGAPLDLNNLASLCAPCHNRRTVQRDGGLGNKPGELKPLSGCDANGVPLDPRHPWRRAMETGRNLH